MTFPIYRKYPHGQSFFEVISKTEFRELKIIGNHYELHHIRAKILPEYNYLEDLIDNSSGSYVSSDAIEFYRELTFSQKQRKAIG